MLPWTQTLAQTTVPEAPTDQTQVEDQGQPTQPVRVSVEPVLPTPPSLQELEAFVRLTGGSVPYPRTPEAYSQLPSTVRAQVVQSLPELAQRLGAQVENLPAHLEAALLRGQVEFDTDDLQALGRAGFVAAVAESRAASRQRIEDQWLAGHQARAEQRAATAEQEAEASKLQQAHLSAAVAAAARAQHLGLR